MILSDKPLIRAFNTDCMEILKATSENFYDLAIVDPPYGIGEDGKKNHSRGKLAKAKKYTPKSWDKAKPSPSYFTELRRVSKNQIIWGGNYYGLNATPCYIVWDKDNTGDFADCELAWTSFKTAVRKFTWRWNGMLQQNMKDKDVRIHPTQKPVALYRWLLKNYAKAGQKILDTHGGSFSSAVACHTEGYDLDIMEIDKDYFDNGVKRFKIETSQLKLFDN